MTDACQNGGNVTKGVEFCRRDDGNAFAVIELTGEVDVATNSSIRALLRAAFTRALAADAPVVIDCRRVTFPSWGFQVSRRCSKPSSGIG
jgi:hypothetical protein